MAIAVTGTQGQLGRAVAAHLGEQAIPWPRSVVDLTDSSGLRRQFESDRPRAIINCAAYTAVDQAESDEANCRAVNTVAVQALAELCREFEVPLATVSTDYVFSGNPLARPWNETDTPEPGGVYAESKLQGEQAAATLEQHLVLRTCGLYSSQSTDRNFVNTMLRIGGQGKALRVVDDQQCTPSYVEPIAAALCFLLERCRTGEAGWGTYHLTCHGATTWYGFAQKIFELAGLTVDVTPITTAEYPTPATRPVYSVLDTAKYDAVAKELGGPQLPEWEQALEDAMRART